MIIGMKKLDEDEQIKIEIAKEAINKLQEAEALIYANIVKELGEDNDWLHDYIFNCSSTDNDEYTSLVRSKLFK